MQRKNYSRRGRKFFNVFFFFKWKAWTKSFFVAQPIFSSVNIFQEIFVSSPFCATSCFFTCDQGSNDKSGEVPHFYGDRPFISVPYLLFRLQAIVFLILFWGSQSIRQWRDIKLVGLFLPFYYLLYADMNKLQLYYSMFQVTSSLIWHFLWSFTSPFPRIRNVLFSCMVAMTICYIGKYQILWLIPFSVTSYAKLLMLYPIEKRKSSFNSSNRLQS